jgi:hypothetical protein
MAKMKTPITPYKDPVHEAIRKYVCERCVDYGQDNMCHSHDPEGCGIFRSLPDLLAIVHDLKSNPIESYTKAVRERICFKCKNSQNTSEKCEVREHADCGLDNYLPLVVEALEAIDPTNP